MAINLVINRRIHGAMRSFKYPSITICPASVPVIVELCPAAMRATAKRMGASFDPSIGCSNSWACFISPTSVLPVLKNTVAANTRIAAFTKKARFNAMALSIKFNFNAFFMPASSLFIFLVCTSAECK